MITNKIGYWIQHMRLRLIGEGCNTTKTQGSLAQKQLNLKHKDANTKRMPENLIKNYKHSTKLPKDSLNSFLPRLRPKNSNLFIQIEKNKKTLQALSCRKRKCQAQLRDIYSKELNK